MSALQWLATQLAWEQRLGELRSGEVTTADPAHLTGEAKRAA